MGSSRGAAKDRGCTHRCASPTHEGWGRMKDGHGTKCPVQPVRNIRNTTLGRRMPRHDVMASSDSVPMEDPAARHGARGRLWQDETGFDAPRCHRRRRNGVPVRSERASRHPGCRNDPHTGACHSRGGEWADAGAIAEGPASLRGCPRHRAAVFSATAWRPKRASYGCHDIMGASLR